ncbi:MAG: beta-aspartyl-peptidase [Negativicutes bacterium]|nr:beta-aspartyl-peptidase [Negativicutes bacterium]
MITVLRNAEVYAPEPLGRRDVLLAGGKIAAIGRTADDSVYKTALAGELFADVEVMDAGGAILTPGFIDSHVHILGGGGEGGYRTRTPEIQLSDIVSGGITTVVGCLGTDGVSRSLASLLAKARGLEEEGITTFIYTGSYGIPVHTVTGSIQSDLLLIDKVIGVGEVAISDHRSSQPTFDDFARVVADTRVGGMLAGKAGVVNIHIGDGERRLAYLKRLVGETEIPARQVIPTHINRTKVVLDAGYEFARLGGYVDLTTSSDPEFLEEDEVKASDGLRLLLKWHIPVKQILFSSDGQGSMPIFNKQREYVGLGVGSVQSLYREVRDAVRDGLPLETALRVITANVADALKLSGKGRIAVGKDADLVVLDPETLAIRHVVAKGRLMVRDGEVLVRGTFEK